MKITPEMAMAQVAAKNPDGIVRHPGGFWRSVNPDWSYRSFGTSTIQALVTRGIAAYTEFKQGRAGRFPVRIELVVDGVAPPERICAPWTPSTGYFAANPHEVAA